jgi:abequosyltransferase
MTPTLSICITSRNRAALLVETLDTLIPQLTSDCQVVIVDGASTDDTPARMQAISSRIPNFIYHRLEISHGLDPDFDLAVRLATGRYAWLLSDDDWIYPHAVQAILQHTASNPGLILLNADVFGPDMKQRLSTGLIPPGTDYNIAPGDTDSLALAAHHLLTFIGSVVVLRDLWTPQDLAPYYGTGFVHVGALLGKKLDKSVIIDSAPKIQIRYGNATWNTKAFKVWNHDWPKLIWELSTLSDDVKTRITPRFPATRVMHLVSFKIKGCYSPLEYKTYVRPHATSWLNRLASWVLAYFPNGPFNLLMRAYFSIKRADSPMLWFELANNPHAWGRGRK